MGRVVQVGGVQVGGVQVLFRWGEGRCSGGRGVQWGGGVSKGANFTGIEGE